MPSANKPIVVSGMQPSGTLHIGNYLGALKNWVEIQNSNKYNCFFFVADYHSLTENYDPKEKRKQIFELVCDYLAAGLNPKKSTIFIQSQVSKCTELAWIFNTMTPLAELERMTQFKDKSDQQKNNANAGLLNYPILQAADILIYHGELVPVGQDQVQHLELTRDIARWFNKKYETDYFPEAKPLLTPTPKIMSPILPKNKMSKSLGKKHWIGIDEDPEEVKKKISKAVTTTEGINNLRTIYDAFDESMPGEFNPKSMAMTKATIAQGINDYFLEFKKNKTKFKKNKSQVEKILADGKKKATDIAQDTIEDVKKIIGVTI